MKTTATVTHQKSEPGLRNLHLTAMLAAVTALALGGCGNGERRGDPAMDERDAGPGGDAAPSRPDPSDGCRARDPDDFSGRSCDEPPGDDPTEPGDGGPDEPRDAGADDEPAMDAGRDDEPTTDAGMPDAAAPPPACPWPEGDCSDRCTLSARAEDPCEGATTVSGGTLLTDTVWDGHLCVEGTVGVAAGITLTIEPGSEIYFAPGAELSTEGHVHAVGTDTEPILLSGDGLAPRASHWRGIHVQLTEGGSLELRDATVEHGEWGVATWEHASDRTYAGSETTVDVRETLLRYNGTGITPDDNTEVTHSTIVCNYTGINVASEDEPLQELRSNNVCHNRNWDVSARQDGADVSDTWWCTTDLSEIEARTQDERDDLSMGGLLTLEPFRSTPVPEAPALP